MSTPLRLKALDLWELFLNKTLWKFPVYWEPREKILKSSFEGKAHLKSFYFSELLLVLFVGAGCSGFTIVKQIFAQVKSISLLQLLIVGNAGCLALTGALFSLSFVINRRQVVAGFQAVLQFEINIKNNDDNLKNRSFDLLGLILNSVVGFIIVFPVIIPFVCFLDLDPLVYIFQLLYSQSTENIHSVLLGIRIFLQIVVSLGVGRTLSLAMVTFALCEKALLICVSEIRRQSMLSSNFKSMNPVVFTKCIKQYRSFFILIEYLSYEIAINLATVLLSAGLLIEIIATFIVIRMADLYYTAPVIYLITLGLAIIVPVLAVIELPEAVALHEKTKDIMRLWMLQASFYFRRKYILKVLKAMRPCSFCSGINDFKFFPVKKSTTTTYYSTMIYYVVTVLISVPA